MADRPLRHLFWRVADQFDYLVTLSTLRILDALPGPLPETPADQQRARDRDREQIGRAFASLDSEELVVKIKRKTPGRTAEICGRPSILRVPSV